MDHAFDLSPAPGRVPIPLAPGWVAVFLEPVPGALFLGLCLDGQPVEVVDEEEDVRGHLAGLIGSLRPAVGSRPTRPSLGRQDDWELGCSPCSSGSLACYDAGRMNAPLRQRVEQFVQEILELVERVSSERRTEALGAVTTLLAAEADRHPRKGALAPGAPTSSTRGRASRKPSPSPGSDQDRPRNRRRTPSETTASPGLAPVGASNGPTGRATRAKSSSGAEDAKGLASVAAVPSPAAPGTEAPAAGPVAEREGQVLAAVRALGRPTAREVAGHTGLPNGSVAVALRALGARGLVARTESGRGIEYTVPPRTAQT